MFAPRLGRSREDAGLEDMFGPEPIDLQGDPPRVTPIRKMQPVKEGDIIYSAECHFAIVDKVYGPIIKPPITYPHKCLGAYVGGCFKIWIECLKDGCLEKIFEYWADPELETKVADYNNRAVCLVKDTISGLQCTISTAFKTAEDLEEYRKHIREGIRRTYFRTPDQ